MQVIAAIPKFLYLKAVSFSAMALIKQVKRETVRKEWRAISLLFAQLIIVVLIVVQLLQIAGLHVDFYLRQLVLKPSTDPSDFIVLAIAIIAFVLLYLAVKKRQPGLFLAEKKAPGIIKQGVKQKLQKVREPQAAALLLVEIFFVATVVLALRAFFDPQLELIPWSRVGIGPPVTTVVNVFIALVVLGIFYYLYSFTSQYRKR